MRLTSESSILLVLNTKCKTGRGSGQQGEVQLTHTPNGVLIRPPNYTYLFYTKMHVSPSITLSLQPGLDMQQGRAWVRVVELKVRTMLFNMERADCNDVHHAQHVIKSVRTLCVCVYPNSHYIHLKCTKVHAHAQRHV